MAAYHVVLVHFPIALWTTAALIILIRALSNSEFARNCDRVLVPLLVLGAITGAVAYGVGLMVWPTEALTASPLGRNHMLAASWTLAYWIVLTVVRWKAGPEVWDGIRRWVMLGLAGLGAGMLTVTGTLGGHLVGTATAVSQVLRMAGWEVYTSFYVPDITLVLIGVATLLLVAIAVVGGRKSA